MIAQPSVGNYLKGLIKYNEDKVNLSEAKLLYANNVTGTVRSFEHQYFSLVSGREAKYNLLHVSLNFHENDREALNDEKLLSITQDFLKGNSIPLDHPYLVYQHFDKGHPHLHVAIPLFLENGKQIPTHHTITKTYKHLCREIEAKYNLTATSSKRVDKSLTEVAEGERVSYESEVQAIEATLRKCMRKRPENLKDLEKYLQREKVIYNGEEVIVGAEQAQKHKGVTFYLQELKQDSDRFKERTFNQVCRGIRGSKVPGNYGLPKLTAQFDKNVDIRKKRSYTLQQTISHTLSTTASAGFNSFNATLEREGKIKPTYFYGKEGQIFGLEFTDLQTGAVFKGSDLQYPWSKLKANFGVLPQMPKPIPQQFTIQVPVYEAVTLHFAEIPGITISDVAGTRMKALTVRTAELKKALATDPVHVKQLVDIFDYQGKLENHDALIKLISEKKFVEKEIQTNVHPVAAATPEQREGKIKQTTTKKTAMKPTEPIIQFKEKLTYVKDNFDLVEFAQSKGYKIIEGKNSKWTKLKLGDDVIVATKQNNSRVYNFYLNQANTTEKGDIANFLVNKGYAQTQAEAVDSLLGDQTKIIVPTIRSAQPVEPAKPKETFVPIGNLSPVKNSDYIVQGHGIPAEFIKKFFPEYVTSIDHDALQKELIKLYGESDTRNNFKFKPQFSYNVFPIFDLTKIHTEKVVVGQEVATKKFKHLVRHSSKETGAWYAYHPLKTKIAVAESPAKSLAFLLLHDQNAAPFATSGTPSSAIIDYLVTAASSGMELVLGGDNDTKGQLFNFRIAAKMAQKLCNVTLVPSLEPSSNPHDFKITLQADNAKDFKTNLERLQAIASRTGGLVVQDPDKANSAVLKYNLIVSSATATDGEKIQNERANASMMFEALNQFNETFNTKIASVKPLLKDFNDDLLEKQKQQIRPKM